MNLALSSKSVQYQSMRHNSCWKWSEYELISIAPAPIFMASKSDSRMYRHHDWKIQAITMETQTTLSIKYEWSAHCSVQFHSKDCGRLRAGSWRNWNTKTGSKQKHQNGEIDDSSEYRAIGNGPNGRNRIGSIAQAGSTRNQISTLFGIVLQDLDDIGFQLRKMEKDRVLFLDEKRNAMARRERLLDTLKRERQQLQDRLMALRHGPHARNESKVNIMLFKFISIPDAIWDWFVQSLFSRRRRRFSDCCAKRKRLQNRWKSKKFKCGNWMVT